VIAAFDAEDYLEQAIESVLVQTLEPSEVIVVDDGSWDGTYEVARAVGDPVRCVRQARAGVSAALNRGVELARGSELAFLDADDVWLPQKLSLQVRALSQEGDLDLVFGHVRQFHSPELNADQRSRIALSPHSVPGICKGTMLIRRQAFARVGWFATQWTLGEFVDWYARAVDARLRSAVLAEVVMHRRLHLANSGIRERDAQSDFPRILKTILDRREGGRP
jgi:glycosyltransferase involved in cell wall biosynthesis